MGDDFKELISLCKAGVSVRVNDHRGVYQSVEQALEGLSEEDRSEISDDIVERMRATDTMVEVQAYPRTPVGSYVVFHYDVDVALAEVLAAVKGQGLTMTESLPVQQVIDNLRRLASDREREEFIEALKDVFCLSCGALDPRCHCENDE